MEFTHLHTHSHYSLLDGVASAKALVQNAKKKGMKSLAVTDHGNMHAAFEFVNVCQKENIKPIIGCEFYLCDDMNDTTNRMRYHQLLLAKNATGYKNLINLSSLSYRDGFYYKPRIDKKLLFEHSEGVIATTSCLQGEIPQAILNEGEDKARSLLKQWIDVFGEDYYIELMKHETVFPLQKVNPVLEKLAKEFNVVPIATNDVHYCEKEDAEAQEILLCVKTGKEFYDPKRMRFEGNSYYMKTPEEMFEAFQDISEVIENTQHIVEKVQSFNLTRDILMPNFDIPEEFKTQGEYLRTLSYKGLKRRFEEIPERYSQRLEMELSIILDMGFEGYFLIVNDFIKASKELNVMVGPGRGSAAGSLVAYALEITSVDPIEYDLLFERFLNPERISMPDIDIDFDDEGRQRIIDYVCEKYGRDKVAQIITFGKMKSKSAIKDVGRVLALPISETNRLSGYIQEDFKGGLREAIPKTSELKKELEEGSDLIKKTLQYAQILEGTIRQTGVHAAGIIIAPDDIKNFVPVSTAKDSTLMVTQFEGTTVENAGMLKMDFLGLKTLSITRDAIKNIEETTGEKIDFETIPLNDEKAFELFQRGDTTNIFQFESDGMKKCLQDLCPQDLEDLIAMNALYRPGPIKFIETYIARKHGKEKTSYPHPLLEDSLKKTYGIMVYQEQIMQAAQIMANYSLGEADVLRRAMGKKKVEVMDEQKEIFTKRAIENGIIPSEATDVFNNMEKFAEYGFNRSHSAAYGIMAYKTGFLKANYSTEFMASALAHNKDDLKEVAKLLIECKRMNIEVLPPNINRSSKNFIPTKEGKIIFGLSAIKGLGGELISNIVNEREENGDFLSLDNLARRLTSKTLNKKSLESFVYSGAFDVFEKRREAYFIPNDIGETGIDIIIKYVKHYQKEKDSDQPSLFDEIEGEKKEEEVDNISLPELKEKDFWHDMEKYEHEEMVTGTYLSGHPLDIYKPVLTLLEPLENLKNIKTKGALGKIGGIIRGVNIRTAKSGNEYAFFTIEDHISSYSFAAFGDNYVQISNYLKDGLCVYAEYSSFARRDKNGKEAVDLKIKSLKLLASALDDLAKQLIITLNIDEIRDGAIEKLKTILLHSKAEPSEEKKKVFFILKKKNTSYTLFSARKYAIDVKQLDLLAENNFLFALQ